MKTAMRTSVLSKNESSARPMVREVEYPTCALCGSAARQTVYPRMHDDRHSIAGEFTVVRCAQCRLIYLSPRPVPERLADYYPAEYEAHQAKDDTVLEASRVHPVRRRRQVRAVWRDLARRLYRLRFGPESATLVPFGHRRLLDVGCGSGWYLCEMQQCGWDVLGVDSSPAAVAVARQALGDARVQLGTIEELDGDLVEFDLITMSHVLEHVPDPRALLREVHGRLAADGKLRVIVPDVTGFEARLFGRYWFGLDVPRHLYQFSRRTLTDLLQQTGFAVEAWRPQFFPRLWTRSFDRLLELGLHVRQPRVRHLLAEPLLLPAVVSYLLGNRGAIDVIAGKSRESPSAPSEAVAARVPNPHRGMSR